MKDYLNELNKKQKKRRKAITAAVVLIAMVVVSVIGSLTQYGVAMTDTTRTARCGQEEHTHSADCYENRLVCNLEEETGHSHTDACYRSDTPLCGLEEGEGHVHTDACYQSNTPLCGLEESEGHVHTDDCYEESACTLEEHTHTDICYSDTSADVEDANVWNEQYQDVEWEGDWGDRLVTAAKMQIGYQESEDNYTVAEDGSRKGYTRYGQFAAVMYEAYKNNPDTVYTDWDAAFADFCMFYAGLKGLDIFPDEIDAAKWCDEFIKKHEANDQTSAYLTSLTEAEGYTPEAGDLVFFEKENEDGAINEDGTAEKETRMGIVTSYNKEEKDNKVTSKITVIEGDSSDQVRENEYILEDEDNNIARYVKMAEIEKVYQELNKEPGEDETNEPAEKPAEDPDGEEAGNQKPDEEESGDQKQDQPSEDDKDPSDSKEKEDDKDQSEDDQKKNSLTEEEQAEVDAVIKMIDELPTEEEVTDKFTELEEDEEGYEAYYQELQKQVSKAKKAYDALSEEQKKAVTNAERLQEFEWLETETLDETESTSNEYLNVDGAYINNFWIEATQDGVTPFDADDNKPGNDKNDQNKRVRTFDSVNYDIGIGMSLYKDYVGKYFREARIKFKFVLPLTEEEGTFDFSSMAWMDETGEEGHYKPQITTEWHRIPLERNTDGEVTKWGEAKECQVLTCYEYLQPKGGNQSVVPGNVGRNVTVNIKNMKNGSKFAPIFYATMEKGTEYYPTQMKEENGKWIQEYPNPVQCEIHKNEGRPESLGIETVQCVAPDIKVTAAPKYNVQIKGLDSYLGEFNFNTGNDGEPYAAANKGKGNLNGRAMKLGLTLQLYNDDKAKGLKGIELPQGEISFDLNLGSTYLGSSLDTSADNPNPDPYDAVGRGYVPLLWSYGQNKSNDLFTNNKNSDGREVGNAEETTRCQSLAPFSDQSLAGSTKINSCYNSGTWTATQNAEETWIDPANNRKKGVIRITVRDYKIDTDCLPTGDGDRISDVGLPVYGDYVGCFSSAAVWIVQPFDRDGYTKKDTTNPNDIMDEWGTGSFTTSVNVTGLKANSVSGQNFEDPQYKYGNQEIQTSENKPVATNATQIVRNDDSVTVTLALTKSGGMVNQIRYADGTDWENRGVGIEDKRNGRDFAVIGTEIRLMSGFNYNALNEPSNQFYYGTNLTKFDAEAIELKNEEYDISFSEGAELQTDGKNSVKVYYAAKTDGKNWGSKLTEDLNGDGKVSPEERKEYEEKKCFEMQSTYEDELIFYESLSALKSANKTCVGILYCFKTSKPDDFDVTKETNPHYLCYHKAYVKDDEKLMGKSYQLVSTSRVWTKDMFNKKDKNLADIAVTMGTVDSKYFSKLPEGTTGEWIPYQSANLTKTDKGIKVPSDATTWYRKETYKEDGSWDIEGTHNSDWSWYGDTLLVTGYKTSIRKNLMQKTPAGTEKKNFNMDYEQKVVDFSLQPEVTANGPQGSSGRTATVIIKDTLPAGLAYRSGSTYFGGTYSQNGANGGEQGTITIKESSLNNDGQHINDAPPANIGEKSEITETKVTLSVIDASGAAHLWSTTVKMTVENNIKDNHLDGTQTITWEMEKVPVGAIMPKIYYSADIAKVTEKKDGSYFLATVTRSNGELLNTVTISAPPGDIRKAEKGSDNYSEAGINVTGGWATSYGKKGTQKLVERNGVIDYTIFYNNNSTKLATKALMVDIMPINNQRGNDFNGHYELNSWKLDGRRCTADTLAVYYTTAEKYKNPENLKDLKILAESADIRDKNSFEKWMSTGTDNKWKEARLEKSTQEPGFYNIVRQGEEVPVAWVVVGEVPATMAINITMQIKLVPDGKTAEALKSNKYVNTLYSEKDTFEWETKTVVRSLEGLTWMDYDRDGIQDWMTTARKAIETEYQNEIQDKPEEQKEEFINNKIKESNGGIAEELTKDIYVTLLKVPDGTPQTNGSYPLTAYTEEIKTIKIGQQYSLLKQGDPSSYDPVENVTVDDWTKEFRYQFTDLLPGEYAVKFSTKKDNDSDLKDKFKEYKWKAPNYNLGEDDTVDSDGQPSTRKEGEEDVLDYTIIPGIHMPTVLEMEQAQLEKYPNSPDKMDESAYHYHSPNNDSGFYPDNPINFLKVSEDWETPLTNAKFNMINTETGQEVRFSSEKQGVYKVLEDQMNDSELAALRTCYIQYVGTPSNSDAPVGDYVLGANRGSTSNQLTLQPKGDVSNPKLQQFSLYRHSDGSYSIKNLGNNKWIDLENGIDNKNSNDPKLQRNHETTIQLKEGNNGDDQLTTDLNQKWLLRADGHTEDSNTAFYEILWAETANNNWALLDVNGNSKRADNTIWAYDGNGTWAQKWAFISVGDSAYDLYVDENGKLQLNDLLPGNYELTELESPEGHVLLKSPVKVTVEAKEDGRIVISNKDGMTDGKYFDWKIQNIEFYELPKSGGSGIYWYMFGGVLLMSVASMMTYRNKRRGMLKN